MGTDAQQVLNCYSCVLLNLHRPGTQGKGQDFNGSLPNIHLKMIKLRSHVQLVIAQGFIDTQGKGEFTMEYCQHSPVSQDAQAELTAHYKASRAAGNKQ